MERVGVLVRISDDRLGDEKGVARQEADCRRLAAERGWQVAEVYVENDTSAYRRRKVKLHDGTTALRVFRPEYRRLLADLASGALDGLVAYDLDRVARDPRDLEDLIDVVELRGVPAAAATGGLDLSTDGGVTMARVLTAMNNKASRDTARRVRRKLEENALEGKHHGGSRPYGWKEDRKTLEPVEAEVVRHATRLLLHGNSVKAAVRAVNEAGAVNTQGRPWIDATLRPVLLRARNAGLRLHQGVVVGDGQWEPILERDEWERLRVLLTDPARRTTPGAAGRKHLLSGIARCGVCGAPMRVAKGKPYKGVAATIYRCHGSACVTRRQDAADALVADVLCARLARPDAAALLRREDPAAFDLARAEVETLRSRLDVAAADYADGLLDREQLRTITARLRPQLEAAERRVPARAPQVETLSGLAGQPDAAERWAALDISVQRQVVDLLVTVNIDRAPRGPGFKPESVRIDWRA